MNHPPRRTPPRPPPAPPASPRTIPGEKASADSANANPFPENDLPKWLMGMIANHFRNVWKALRGPRYQVLTNFTRDLGICVRSSTEISTGLELCIRAIRTTPLGKSWRDAPQKLRQGVSLTEALQPGEDHLPPFFLPVIKAGEDSGRLDDALQFLEHHCKLLAGPASSLRNLWFYPVVIMMFGTVIRVLICLLMGLVGAALSTFLIEAFGWLQLLLMFAVFMLPPFRYFVDRIRLNLPLIGDFERDVAYHRFFRIMSLLYAVSGQRVEEMIRMAANSVSNRAARIELLRAATAIENKETISDSFNRVSILSGEQKTTIEVGEMAGELEGAFGDISDRCGGNMIAKINYVRPFLMRFVVISTVMAIMSTVVSVVLSVR